MELHPVPRHRLCRFCFLSQSKLIQLAAQNIRSTSLHRASKTNCHGKYAGGYYHPAALFNAARTGTTREESAHFINALTPLQIRHS